MKKLSRKGLVTLKKETIKSIKSTAEAWLLFVNSSNECALTDRYVEDIIDFANHLKEIQEEEFKLISK